MDQIFEMLEDSGRSRQPRNPTDAMSEYERKAMDYAIALSLQEEEQRKVNQQNEIALFEDCEYAEAQTEENEEFPITLHESLEIESLTGSEDGFTTWSYPHHILSGQRSRLSENEDVTVAQLQEGCRSGRIQLIEDNEERFQLSEMEKATIAQLEEDEKQRRMQLMRDEELAMSLWVDSSAETGKGDIFRPDQSSVSSGQGFSLPEYENASISQLENVERRHSSQFTEDGQLAMALQESLILESSIELKKICAGCKSFGHGPFLKRMGADWHSECFRCNKCHREIGNVEFSDNGNRPYHKTCYEEHFHPRCEVCKNFIPTDAQFRYHPFWERKYCPSHDEDGTPQCYSCERLVPKDMKYLSLDDGRKLCKECSDTAIMDTFECEPLYREIKEFFGDLDMKVEQHIPLYLVEEQALNEAKRGQKKGNHDLLATRGLTMFEENEVTAILVLKGLPRLLLGNILAHEMMHSWLRLKGYHNLRLVVEEGICQVMARLWLQYEIDKNTNCNSAASSSASSSSLSSKNGTWSEVQQKLADCFKYQIEADTSEIYGTGFKLANEAVVKHGLEGTLAHIQKKKSFPS